MLLLLLAAGLSTDSMVFRKRLDEHGQILLAPNGRPMVEIDQWASFWHGWPSNLSMLAAVMFFCIGIFLVIFRRLHKMKGDRQHLDPGGIQAISPGSRSASDEHPGTPEI